MAKHEVDEAAVERLRLEIASDRERLARAIALAPEPALADERGERSTQVGRLHRIFTLMGAC